MNNRLLKEHGAMKQMAKHFGLSENSIRQHLTGKVCTWRTREIVEYARENYTIMADAQTGGN